MGWFRRRDDKIDGLIAANRAKPRAGMEAVDWQKTDRAGERRSQQVAAAQARIRNRSRGLIRFFK